MIFVSIPKAQLRYAVLVLEQLCNELLAERDCLRSDLRRVQADLRAKAHEKAEATHLARRPVSRGAKCVRCGAANGDIRGPRCVEVLNRGGSLLCGPCAKKENR